MLGNLRAAKGEHLPARELSNKVVGIAGLKHDTHSRLSIANSVFGLAQGKVLTARTEKYLREAKGTYRTILSAEPRNVAAANGLGMVLAEEGSVASAREAFELVRTVGDDVAAQGVWVNLGHVYMGEGNYAEAASVYKACLGKFYERGDAEVEMCLAHAHFKSQNFAECNMVMRAAIARRPGDLRLWFNLAISEEEGSIKVLNSGSKDVADVASAISGLESARDTFGWLGSIKRGGGNAAGDERQSATSSASFEPKSPPGSPVMRASKSLIALAKVHDAQRERRKN